MSAIANVIPNLELTNLYRRVQSDCEVPGRTPEKDTNVGTTGGLANAANTALGAYAVTIWPILE